MIESLIENIWMQSYSEDIVETCLTHFGNDFDWEESFEEVNALLESNTSNESWQVELLRMF